MKRQLLALAGWWVILAAYLMLLRPGSLPVILLVVPFLLLFLALYSTWTVVGLYAKKTGVEKSKGKQRLGAVICGSIVLLLVLQSLGQLTLRDVVTLMAIVAIGYLYVVRSRAGVS